MFATDCGNQAHVTNFKYSLNVLVSWSCVCVLVTPNKQIEMWKRREKGTKTPLPLMIGRFYANSHNLTIAFLSAYAWAHRNDHLNDSIGVALQTKNYTTCAFHSMPVNDHTERICCVRANKAKHWCIHSHVNGLYFSYVVLLLGWTISTTAFFSFVTHLSHLPVHWSNALWMWPWYFLNISIYANVKSD